MLLADIALPVPLSRPFTYAVPDALAARVEPGARVTCPFSGRRMVGVVLAVRQTREGEPPPKVKAIVSVVGDEPTVPSDLLAFLKDVSQYYLAPIGEVLRLALPPVEKDVARGLEEPTLFGAKAKGVGARKVQWVTAAGETEGEAKLGARAKAIVTHLRAVGTLPIARIEERWPGARSSIKRLGELGVVAIEEREVPADPFFAEEVPRDVPPDLTEAQASSVAAITGALRESRATTFLLHGVTGSGKTEVYLRAIAVARETGIGVIVLVPEIALTPQLVARFRARFGDEVAVLHSGLTARERHAMWSRLHAGKVDVAIGARSALFAPVRKLGLVVVDEEHDGSFKQEEGVRYNARDMAILRTHRVGGVCVLGSATPSLETEHLARTGKAQKLVLPDRARMQSMPRVEIVDLRRIGAGPTGDKRISLPLHRALESTLAHGEQAILFLNRRGFSPSVRCQACGEMSACPHCSVALTFHKRAGSMLRCHYCEFETGMPGKCAKCDAPGTELALEGLGTEKLEETLSLAFPTARIARLDRDIAGGGIAAGAAGAGKVSARSTPVERVLARMRAREIDILVGTQMVTKGHDLPHVTLVGVVNADAALSIPDFRAAERAFQLFVQVAGRAGRGDVPGRVLVQTYDPEHHAIVFAAKHDVTGFIERELVDRRELGYPPFSRVALVRVDAVDEDEARNACGELARIARAAAEGGKVEVLGPAPAPLTRLRGRHRFRLMARSADRAALRKVLLAVERARGELPRNVRSGIDVDPMQFL